MKRIVSTVTLAIVLTSATMISAQQLSAQTQTDPKTTPAYSKLILRKVKVQAELEKLLQEESSDYPAAKALQFELDALEREMKNVAATRQSKVSKLTASYATLILRKVSLESEVQTLLIDYTSDWPEIKVKQTELDLLEKEIQKVMK